MKLPLLVTNGLVALPGVMVPLDVSREESIVAVRTAQANDGRLVMALDDGNEIHRVGTLVELHRVSAMPQGRLRVTLRTLAGARIDAVNNGIATVAPLASGPEAPPADKIALCELVQRYAANHPGLDDAAGKLFDDATLPTVILTGLASQIVRFEPELLQALLASPAETRAHWMIEELQHRIGALPGRQNTNAPAPQDAMGPMPDTTEEGIAWTVRLYLRTGLLNTDDIAAATIDAWRTPWNNERGGIDGIDAFVTDTIDRVVIEENQRKAGFPEITSCDRLERALTNLENEGFVTGLLGVDLADAIATAQNMNEGAPYALFHQLDLIDAVQGNGLSIAFGGNDPVAVGQRVVNALQAEGLDVNWPGRADVRIQVAMRWERIPGNLRRAA
jgi:hypothetical protein